jgi:hypothetical protein
MREALESAAWQASPHLAKVFREIARGRPAQDDLDDTDWIGVDREPGEEG